jgi:hypothetical protein
VTADEYVAELTGEHPVIPDKRPARPQQHVPRHRRSGTPTAAMMTVSVHDLRHGPSPVWQYPTSLPPAPSAGVALGQLVIPPEAPVPGAREPLAAPAVTDGERKGPPTVVFEVVRPNIAAGLDPYLAELPAYSEDPGSA